MSSSSATRLWPPSGKMCIRDRFYNVCQIRNVKTLDFGKLAGFVYFSTVITFCFYALIHLKRMLPFAQYRYDAIYFILLILCFAWGGDTRCV